MPQLSHVLTQLLRSSPYSSLVLLAPSLPSSNHLPLHNGYVSLTSALILTPGIHKQLHAWDANRGEYPAVAAMTTGYVFRVENEATVGYLQRVGATGALVEVQVDSGREAGGGFSNQMIAASLPILVMWIDLLVLEDFVLGMVLIMLIGARAIFVGVLRRRLVSGWHGVKEPEVKGDLLVLLSRDRWIRVRGLVDDLKAVTSGQWMRESNRLEASAESLAQILVFLAMMVSFNLSVMGGLTLLMLLLGSSWLVAVCAYLQNGFTMNMCRLKVTGVKKYVRRLDMAHELVKETKRDDWAIRLGLINQSVSSECKSVTQVKL